MPSRKRAGRSEPAAAAPPPELLSLRGVGPSGAWSLASAGMATQEDLLWWLPFRYEDRRNPVPLGKVTAGQWVCARARVTAIKARRGFRRGIHVTEALLADDTGNLYSVWFNQPWLEGSFPPGTEVYLYGRVELFSVRGGLRLQLDNPEVEKVSGDTGEVVHSDRIVPVYRKAGKLGSKALRTIFHRLFEGGALAREVLPSRLVDAEALPSRTAAFHEVHFPPPDACIEDLAWARTGAQGRLVLEEFLRFQWSIAVARKEREGKPGVVIAPAPGTGDLLRRVLPFKLTAAQRRALREIAEDLKAPAPMYRLLHGEVASGKTILAFLVMLAAADVGFQSAFMAPTEVLARQQHLKLSQLLDGTGFHAALLTATVTGKARNEVLEGLASGRVQMAVGTHSLFQEGVAYARLGLVVIDEQHRFGVEQRARLVAKGESPNVLVMTATPIPRSLAMTLYGDLDISVLDELPPGRQPIVTALRGESGRHRVEAFVRKEMDAGRQVFFVFPLVEESEESDLKAATQAFLRFQSGPFRGYPMALLHGRMKPSEKEDAMARVRRGEVRLLVATTVVEVGVDLPEASVIVVEHADRFGLAQLHQMRGRVGRGGDRGYCILMHDEASGQETLDRLGVMEKTQSGFEIAEADLAFRGPGDMAGTRQWGGAGFRIASPARHMALLKKARDWALEMAGPGFPWSGGEKERFVQWVESWQERSGSYGRIG